VNENGLNLFEIILKMQLKNLRSYLEDMEKSVTQTDDEIHRLMERIKILEKANKELEKKLNNK